VSVSQAEYNVKSNRLEVGLKVFTDDLERVIYSRSNQKLLLNQPADRQKAADFLVSYLPEQFELIQKGKKMSLFFVGLEPGPDETWVYFEIKMPGNGSFEVKNTIFFDEFPAQINILHLEINQKNLSYYFSTDKPLINVNIN
jgi:hypothetical protein